MLSLRNIVKEYKSSDFSVTALKGISVDFRENEFVSILGPSGCGKTTLLNIIGGLDHYTSGDMSIKGTSTKEFKDRDWDSYRNHSVGFVFQSYNLIPHQSVAKNVELALTISGMSRKERKAKAIQALERVGLGKEINKRPNQLSGGQMQRVAIARAIVNDPEILLADEPTGALDTATSVQILDLIKDISKERLVIMVTHNPDLATKYSNRIIKLLDGEIVDDSHPYDESKSKKKKPKEENIFTCDTSKKDTTKLKKKRTKTSMSMFTALSLSFRNLLAKKGRTILTSIAGSIGIIGIALVLALANGFDMYIDKMQADTLSSYPMTISENALDTESIVNMLQSGNEREQYTDEQKVFVNDITSRMSQMFHQSTITQEYVDNVIKPINPDLYNDIVYSTGVNLESNFYVGHTFGESTYYTPLQSEVVSSESGGMMSEVMDMSLLSRLSVNREFVESQYDVIYGNYPTKASDLVLIVDRYNQISDITLKSLGMLGINDTETKELDFDKLQDFSYLLVPNDQKYSKVGDKFATSLQMGTLDPNGLDPDIVDLKICGVMRAKETTQTPMYSSGLCYTNALYDYLVEKNIDSEIVSFLKDPATRLTNPFLGQGSTTMDSTLSEENANKLLRALGGYTVPNEIDIYAKDFECKARIKQILDEYNATQEEANKIYYNDIMQIMADTLSTMIDAISYVLIAFTSISLVVSSIMISIITYVSVIERTREIGVLRSIGARKKDISRVFNAETFIIGLTAGLIGVVVTYILTIPINLLLSSLLPSIGNLANLSIISAVILVAISTVLTIISGLIPSYIASRKDPVEALRTE